LRVDSEFEAICPPLSPDEYENLEAAIVTEGCRDALVVWAENDILLDGHNRKRICEKYGLNYKVTNIELPDREAAIQWIILNQLGRRNLHPDAASLLRGRLYNSQKQAPHSGENQYTRGEYQNDTHQTTAARLSSQLGVSAPTIKRDGKFAEAVETLTSVMPDLPQQVMTGQAPARKEVIEAAKEPETAREHFAHVGYNSGNNEWYTPPEYIEAARAVMGDIDCDPASSDIANAAIKAKTYYTAADDGLSKEWRGRVWMNPPYAQPLITEFCETLASRTDTTVSEACVLVNNATETGWYSALLNKARAVCFIKGRIKFIDVNGKASGAPLQGQTVLYFGNNTDGFTRHFGRFGKVLYATR